ncbi:hypothetical protein [Chlorogloeopsis sp. ULAP02]
MATRFLLFVVASCLVVPDEEDAVTRTKNNSPRHRVSLSPHPPNP